MTPEAIKAISVKINDLLPDDPRLALSILAINYACAAACMGVDDESALNAIRKALRQMRDHNVGRDYNA